MNSSGGISHYQGADPDLLNELTRLLEQAGRDLLDHRLGTERLLASVGGTTAVLDDLRLVEDWIGAAAADARRRAGAAAAPLTTFPGVAGFPPLPLPAAVVATSRPVTTPIGRAEPCAVRRVTSRPVFEPDALSGMGISGYAVAGLAYHHLGVERRTVTTVVDHGGEWTETVVEHQSRGVFEVNPGLGYGTFALASFGPHRLRDPWRHGRTTRTYAHDGQPASAAEFQAAAG